MMSMFLQDYLSSFAILLFALPAFASLEGIDRATLEKYKVAGHSRPCCNFALSYVTDALGVSKLIGPESLGHHQFAPNLILNRSRPRENFGVAYTCRAGFVDIAHARDNADWTAHLIWLLPRTLGSGTYAEVQQEGGARRRLFFPKLSRSEVEALAPQDLALIARRISYEIALWHEILTGFGAHVSTPFSSEISSSFSVEDNYSNLLGTFLGAEAALDPRPFEDAMTDLLARELAELGAVPLSNAKRAHESVRDLWWKESVFPTKGTGMKRNMQAFGAITPWRIPHPESGGCSGSEDVRTLEVPEATSAGAALDRFFELEFIPNFSTSLKVERIFGEPREVLYVSDFTALIAALGADFRAFLGPEYDRPY